MELKLYIRQTRLYNKQAQEVYLAATNPQKLAVQQGTLPPPRQWRGYNNYLDVTDQVSNLYKLKLTWTLQRTDFGTVSNAPEQKKAASGILTFEGESYRLIKQWLIDDISAPQNRIDVQIKHVGCGDYLDWSIRATDLTWCENSTCIFDVNIKQQDENLACIQQTLITDDWQGWFGDDLSPSSGKRHPRFSYCNEIRPNGILTLQWFAITLVIPLYTAFIAVLAVIWNSIVAVFLSVLKIIQFIINITGGDDTNIKKSIDDLQNKRIDLKDVQDVVGNFFVESAGCGREHPMPLIRDYIQNVCDKCNIRVTPSSAPIFFASQISIQTSMDKQQDKPAQIRYNPHYYDCYASAFGGKGIRRQKDITILEGAQDNQTDWWKPENSPLLTLDEFLNQLRPIFNASWRITNNTLYFQRKDYWIDENTAFNFSAGNPDRDLLLEGLCFEWDEVNDPVLMKGLYALDPADTPGNAAATKYMNSSISFGDTLINPNLSGIADKTVQFGGTKFRLDGADNDYIMDALQLISNGSIASTATMTADLFRVVSRYFQKYADYALLIQSETTSLPKIITWEPSSEFANAKAVRYYSCTGNVPGAHMPSINPKYNKDSKPWVKLHLPNTYVQGSEANIGGSSSYPAGYYTVRGPFAGTIYQSPAFLVNYPMFFAPEFEGSLWDWFHWIDDPLNNPVLHQNFTAKLELCCDTLKRVMDTDPNAKFNDKNPILGQKVQLPIAKYNEAYINEITVSYDTSDRMGQYIEIKGRL